MKKYFTFFSPLLIFSAWQFSSCATLINAPVQPIWLEHDSSLQQVRPNQPFGPGAQAPDQATRQWWLVKRSPFPLQVEAWHDSIRTLLSLPASRDAMFWANIEFNYGLGMLVDAPNPKSFTYRRHNYFYLENGEVKVKRFGPLQKGSTRLTLGWLPFSSLLAPRTTGKYLSQTILGLQAGLEYSYRSRQYLSLQLGGAVQVNLGKHFGEHFGGHFYDESARNWYLQGEIHQRLGQLDLGAGLGFSVIHWKMSYSADSVPTGPDSLAVIHYDQRRSSALGISVSAQYRLGYQAWLGLHFQPSLFRLGKGGGWDYLPFVALSYTAKLHLNRKQALRRSN